MTAPVPSIHIIDAGKNRTYTCQFPTEPFDKTTISELQLELERIMGVGVFYQHLIFDHKLIVTEENGREMTLGDYNICDGSSITFVLRSLGGGRTGFMPLRIADVSSEDNFEEITLTRNGPKWLGIARGINFQGNCRNRFCQAENKLVMIQKGFYTSTRGMCLLNYEITHLKCPICKHTLDKNEVHVVGVYKAKLQIQYKLRGKSDNVALNLEARDSFLCAGCSYDRTRLDFEYVILTVKRFKPHPFHFSSLRH